MALTSTETAILDLLDQGESEYSIVARGFNPAKVRFTASTFGTARQNIHSDSRRMAAIRRGSRQLARAIQKARAC